AEAKTMTEAVSYAYKMGKKGDVVLLSPACASFDLFQNYEDRGSQFKAAVKAL
ncbi:MAG TPA: UDP-N-acetylmuramoyl-L-alanine--D-glutamate ligase, partial [Bacteroidia bacterium]|nr:UDP-N-acetylmuramoyl-L-alanine--D-glutamate ligase [Bacteroidia bacterium]